MSRIQEPILTQTSEEIQVFASQDQPIPSQGPVLPAVFQLWEQEAALSKECADAWRDYARMMAAFQAALERAPRTAEACTDVHIEDLLITEIEDLANLVSAIFPRGGMMEFAQYVTHSKP